ncbi:WecB/TagA/CpsF family glycosyltransferase [Kocuria coralli]|nr:WecB/TagA/CpsF family glycosyltransferase [Kocuria coralli]
MSQPTRDRDVNSHSDSGFDSYDHGDQVQPPRQPRRRPRRDVMGVGIDPLTMDQTVERLKSLMTDGGHHNHLSINAAKIVSAKEDCSKRREFNAADIVSADGQAVVWASRLLGRPVPERVAGIDLMNRLVDLSAAEGQRIYLLGAQREVVDAVAEEFAGRGANIVGKHDGFWRDEGLTDEDMAKLIGDLHVDLLFVAVPSPMKEDFIYGQRDLMGVGVCVGVGGSFDVVAGQTKRAPELVQKLGMEWAFRLAMEPRRMFKRYAVGNTKFLWYLAKDRTKSGE